MARVRGVMQRHQAIHRAALGLALMLAAGSCAQTPKPQPVPPAPRPAPPPVVAPPAPAPVAPAGDWDELPVIEGAWTYDGARRMARFVDDSGLERASLTCAARVMRLTLAGDAAATATILTSAGQNNVALVNGAAELGINDIALDRMAFSRGRFGLRASTLLVLPVQAEIGRVIEDCRE